MLDTYTNVSFADYQEHKNERLWKIILRRLLVLLVVL
ncbi:MAG: hypothetical protein H6Q13_2828 [Bacteroidetes bacterium]|nr:hypothetical protein [Bacteroidota bacterium]